MALVLSPPVTKPVDYIEEQKQQWEHNPWKLGGIICVAVKNLLDR